MKNRDARVPATEFKAKCLELMQQVHDRKRNNLVVTKRGKPFVKVVPVDDEGTSFLGCMKGMIQIQGDLTEPTGQDWEALED